MMTGSLSMQDIIIAQGGPGVIGESRIFVGGWPWYWFCFRNPVTLGLFFLRIGRMTALFGDQRR